MRGLSKRFVNHKGDAYKLDMAKTKKNKKTQSVSFLQLWRYAYWSERLVTLLGALFGAGAALALVAAITLYSELTSLFVFRHQQSAPTQLILLPLFGGAAVVEGDRSVHMDALVQDSLAFAYASFAVMAVQLSAAALSICLTNWAAQRHIARVRHKLLESVLNREMSWFDTETSLSFANTLNEDTERLLTAVGSATAGVSYLLGAALAGAGAALAAGAELAGAGLLLVPLAAGAAVLQDKYQTRYSERESVASGVASHLADEVLQQATTVRAYQAAGHEEERYRNTLLCVSKHSKDKGRWAGLANAGGWFFSYLLNAVVLAVGAWLLVRDLSAPVELRQYDAGVVVQVLFCTFMCAQNIALLQPHIDSISSARGAACTLLKLLAGDSSQTTGSDRGPVLGHIILKGIGFSYPARCNEKVLKDFNLEIQAGQTVALVGASGSGKSSVLQLLLALYRPGCGTITVDGRDLITLDTQHYRRSIGVVGQESVVFHMSVRDNITLGAMADITHEQIVQAAKLANAYDFIMKLPQGFDTELGQITLSGGQKQRLSLTRALVREPRVLLLDEPTAALDVRSERIVQDALDAAAKGRTTIVVSHRLSTIRNADKIVVVSEGSVVEEGSHAELMEARGHYWNMIQTDHHQRSASDTETTEDDATEDDRDDVPEPFIRHSSIRESRISNAIRHSCRLGSVTAARLPNALQGLEDVPELPIETPTAASPKSASPHWWVLLRLNAPETKLLVGGAMAAMVVGGSMPVFALLFANIYEMFGSSSGDEILYQSRVYASAFAFVAACCGVAAYIQGTLLGTAGDRLTTRLRVNTFRALLRDGGGVGRDITAEEASSRLSADCSAVQGAAGGRLGTSLQGVSTMLLGGALSLAYSWRMSLVSAAVLPVVLLLLRLEARTSPPPMPTAAAALATNAVRYARTVRSLGCEDQLSTRYKSILLTSPAGGLLRGMVRGAAYGVCLCAPTLGYAVALSYGGYLVAKEDVPYHYVILVSEALIYGAWMLGQALAFAPDFGAAARAGSRILSLINIQPLQSPPAKEGWELRGQITFENVTCSFGSGPVLRGVSFSVQANQTLALVGPSGCGKSTILMLLLRLVEPESGRILLDGVDIRDINIGQLRHHMAIVTQEPAVFSTSIRENIAYGDRSHAPMDEVIKAARKAHAHEFITALPQGYDTLLTASTLSGGQKQRISLARALLRDPRILLLDEPTAALDVSSERQVSDVLRGDHDRTQLVVAHRLVTVRHADLICYVHDGMVAESGTHDELVRKRGMYYQLLQQQPED